MTTSPSGAAGVDVPNPVGLTDLEIASGVLTGTDPLVDPLPDTHLGPRRAFEDAVRVCLERPPCVLSFSGGRDSSAVLAVALDVARREGLPQPIPVTERFLGVPESDEQSWQELVISHLKPDGWEVRVHDDEYDLLGPLATDVLTRHGLLYPEQISSMGPVLGLAGGGTLLTGHWGDDIFWRRWGRAADVLGRRARPEPRDALRVGLAVAPRVVRRQAVRLPANMALPWLEPAAQIAVTAALRDEVAREPLQWPTWLKWLHTQRYIRVSLRSLRLLAAEQNVVTGHPFLAPEFLAALARAGGRSGFSRDMAFRRLFADLLPDAVLSRPTKADFTRVYWNRHSRAFAETWSGTGIDSTLVNAERLRAEWAKSPPHTGSLLLLQLAWLRAHG